MKGKKLIGNSGRDGKSGRGINHVQSKIEAEGGIGKRGLEVDFPRKDGI